MGQALLVALVSHLRPRRNIYATIIVVALASSPLAILGERLMFARALTIEGRIFLVLLHLALGGFLFHFMTLPDRSVTLRMLVELLLAPGGRLTLEELGRRYGVRTMIDSRIAQLQGGGFLIVDGSGEITLAARGMRFGRFVTGGRRLFNISSAN
jgi:hypothetical protein